MGSSCRVWVAASLLIGIAVAACSESSTGGAGDSGASSPGADGSADGDGSVSDGPGGEPGSSEGSASDGALFDGSRDGGTQTDGSENDGASAEGSMGGPSDASTGDAVTNDASDSATPTVVATFSRPPAGLALSSGTLYVTITQSTAGNDGLVVSVPTTATNATPDAGITTMASGQRGPCTIGSNGTTVYWGAAEETFPDYPAVFGVPASGGTTTEVLSQADPGTRLVIANDNLYVLGGGSGTQIWSLPLSSDAASKTVVYPGTGAGVFGLDSDGTSVFFVIPNPTNADLFSISAHGGTPVDLVPNAASGSVAFTYTVDDATTIYWSQPGGKIFSVPKSGGDASTATLLATFPSGSGAPQILLDGANIYALSPSTLARLPKAGGTPVVLASVQSGYAGAASNTNCTALAADDSFVYWLYGAEGKLLKLPK